MSSQTSKTPEVTPFQTIRGYTEHVGVAVHLPGGQRIITSSSDGSLRLWDLENGIQIGDDWRDGKDEAGMPTLALSPNGSTVASGSDDGTVKLWDIRTGKAIVKWEGHTDTVNSVCWGAGGKRVVSGSRDGTARVWDVKSGETVLGPIETGHEHVYTVIYSPENTKIATGGNNEDGSTSAAKIWDAKTGKLLATPKHDETIVVSLAWTSDGQKFIYASSGPIRIFDTATWKQIATLDTFLVNAITLSQNNRLLASTSIDKTARIWNLETNLPVGPPLQHEDDVPCAALSADGKVLVIGSSDKNVYAWDIQAILKNAGLEDLLLPIPHVLARKQLMNNNATRRPPIHARRIPPRFFDEGDIYSSTSRNVHPPSSRRILAPSIGSPHAFLARIPSLFRPSHFHTSDAIELQQASRQGIFSRRGPRPVEVAAVRDRKSLFVAPRPKETQQQSSQSRGQGSSSQSQPAATSTSTTQSAPNSSIHATTPCTVTVRSRLLTLLARLVLLICCAPLPSTDGH